MKGKFSRQRTLPKLLLALSTAALIACGGPWAGLLAQTTTAAGGDLFIEAELGLREYVDRPEETELARFQQYRDDPSGVLVESFRMWWKRDAQRLEMGGRQIGQRDQALGLQNSSLGLYDLRVETERTPHLLSTTARLLGDQPRSDVLTLPTPRPYPLEHDQAALLGRTGVRLDTDRLSVRLSPRPDAPFRAQYTRTTRTGARPMGMAFGGPWGNFREVLAPVDETTHDMRVTQDVATSRIQVRVAYDFSYFANELAAVVSDNPLVERADVDGASQGRTGLAPTSRAHTLSASGGLNLPYRSRITAALSYGVRTQDETFLPQTINARLLDDEAGALPRSLGGEVRTLGVNLSARTRPLASVTVTARYRLFDLDDRTPDVVLPSVVRTDQLVVNGPFERQRYPYTRENAGMDVRWAPIRPVAFGLEYGWERWKRDPDARNAGETTERMPRLTVDVRPFDRIWVQGSYLRSERRADGYVEARDLPLLRRFDQSDRDRDRARVSVQLFPSDAVDLSLSYDRGESSYPDAPYGRQADQEEAWAAHLGWSLGERVMAHGSYVREEFQVDQRSRFRGNLPAELGNPTFDWIGNTDEAIRTVGVGGTVSLLPNRLDLTLAWDRSRGTSQMRAHNPVPPTSSIVANRNAAEAEDFPVISHTIRAAHLGFRYRLTDAWVTSLRYRAERFDNRDFRTQGLAPSTGMDVFLGNTLLGYTAQHLTLTVQYHPWIPGVRRPPF